MLYVVEYDAERYPLYRRWPAVAKWKDDRPHFQGVDPFIGRQLYYFSETHLQIESAERHAQKGNRLP
jgi:hypothetical protein